MKCTFVHLFATITILIVNESEGTAPCKFLPTCKCRVVENDLLRVNCRSRQLRSIPKLPENVLSIDLSGNRIKEISPYHFQNNSLLTAIILSNNEIKTIETDSFVGLKQLKRLHMEKNYVRELEQRSFMHLEKLQILNLQRNNFTLSLINVSISSSVSNLSIDFNKDTFLHFNFLHGENLQKLDVSGKTGHCYLHRLTNDTFETVPNLRFLDISYCKISYVEKGTFRFMKYLSELDLSYNVCLKFSGAKPVIDDLPWTSIKILRISKIHSTFEMNTLLPKSIVEGLTNTSLEELHADSNRIQRIEAGTILKLPHTLRFVSMKDNQFSYGQYMFELFLLSAERIDISYLFKSHSIYRPEEKCQNKSDTCNFDSNAISSESNEEKDNFSLDKMAVKANNVPISRKLKWVKYSDSHFQYTIRSFTLSENNIEYLDGSYNIFFSWIGPILNLDKLKYLDLSNNFCSNISDIFFSGAPNIEHLYVQHNLLGFNIPSDIDGKIFGYLSKLLIINLSDNRIPFFQAKFFRAHVSLRHLLLSNNMLNDLDFEIAHMENLTYIDLSNNTITHLGTKARGELQSLADRKDASENITVNLRGNPIICSCDTIKFVHWMAQTEVLFEHPSKMKCLLHTGEIMTFEHPIRIYQALQVKCGSYLIFTVILTISICLFLVCIICGLVYRYRWKLRYMYFMTKSKFNMSAKENEADDNFQYDAFVSYADSDRHFVHEKFLKMLETDTDIKLCLHKRDFMPGRAIAENITTAIHNSRNVIVIMTRSYLESYWCMYEYHMAKTESVYSRNKQNILFLVFLEQIPSKELPLIILEQVQNQSYIEYPNDEYGDVVFWQKMRDILRHARGRNDPE